MKITADSENAGVRLDVFLASWLGISRSMAEKLIESETAFVNGRAEAKRYTVKSGDKLECTPPAPKEISAEPEDIPLDIIYEDSDIIVINKPSGMVVHPAHGNYDGTLVNALLHHCKNTLSGINGALRPGIVHRIDKDTSGLLVVAKNDEAHRGLALQLADHHITREYYALVIGGFKDDFGTVDLPIGRHSKERKKMAVTEGGRCAVTHYEVLERFGSVTLLKLSLETGRTHQIRVHMSHLGHPLLGDTVYGGGKTKFEREHCAYIDGQCLHAKRLSFTHPISGKPVSFETELPNNFKHLIEILRKEK